ncbi:Uncharacterized protein ToN1_41460 [Aromatoleum petrolei]|nr:Uncharacterized protein ToN1_41460 [Aromatoleum petrolei]
MPPRPGRHHGPRYAEPGTVCPFRVFFMELPPFAMLMSTATRSRVREASSSPRLVLEFRVRTPNESSWR